MTSFLRRLLALPVQRGEEWRQAVAGRAPSTTPEQRARLQAALREQA